MQDLLDQIRSASQAGLYFAALFPALALPDICGALESSDGLATGAKYTAWFDQHIAPRYRGSLTGRDCYLFRCSLLHQGKTVHPAGRYSRILLVEPGVQGIVMHNNVLHDALNIDIGSFCEDLTSAAEVWLPQARRLPHFAAHLAQFVTRYPSGLPPYIVGVPVVG